MKGFFFFQVSEISLTIKLSLKLTGLRWPECSRWQIFFSWSFMVSMINLRPGRGLSPTGIDLFFILDLRLVIRSNPSSNSCSKSFLPGDPWSVKSSSVRPGHQSFNRSSIIDIAGGNFKSQRLAYLIDDQMKLGSKRPSPTGFPSTGQTLKDFISGDWNVSANGYRARVSI